jgi:2-(3-amino-3-carboxypropyl)histidine synthase
MFNLTEKNYNTIKEFIKNNKIKILTIQAPEGLKTNIQEISKNIEKQNKITTLIYLEPCYGACDIPDLQIKHIKSNGLLHIGHSKYIKKTKIPTLYIELETKFNHKDLIEKNITKLKKYKTIGLITTIQHINSLKEIKQILNQNNIQTIIGNPKLAKYSGQILGCDQTSATSIKTKINAYLYIGTGIFHPLGLARLTNIPILLLNPQKKEIETITENEKNNYEKTLYIKYTKYKDAKNIGIIISTKKGQFNKNYNNIKTKLEKNNKNSYLLLLDHLSKEKIEGLQLDFLINTACPRIEEDKTYKIPILNWNTIKKFNR